MQPHDLDSALTLARTRRHFFRDCGVGLGSIALGTLLAKDTRGAPPRIHAAPASPQPRKDPLAPKKPHFDPKAKAVIYLFMAGAPSQLELFEPKPELNKLSGQKVPESFTQGKRFAFIKGDAKLLGSARKFSKAGKCGMDVSELFPHHAEIADEL